MNNRICLEDNFLCSSHSNHISYLSGKQVKCDSTVWNEKHYREIPLGASCAVPLSLSMCPH